MLLEGKFNLNIITKCNLHCVGCSTLDYPDRGIAISDMSLDDVQQFCKVLSDNDIILEEILLMGGEPTLHPQFSEIVDYLMLSDRCHYLSVVTNGTNLTSKNMKILEKLDRVFITDYLLAAPESKKISDYEWPENFEIWTRDSFNTHGIREEWAEPRFNWDNCYMKDDCRVATTEGVYRCAITHAERTNMAEWTDHAQIDSIFGDEPFERCGTCNIGYAPYYQWKSHKPEIDRSNYIRGIKLIDENS